MHEASCWDENSFVTFTYADDPKSLDYRDFQLFMKRLRKHFRGRRIRFYVSGEYGDATERPHFHAVLFNCGFPDRVPLRLLGGAKLYRSDTLSRLWGHGSVVFGAVTFESAAYVARYCVKKVTGKAADSHYRRVDVETGEVFDLTPEMGRMSLRPGIGALWLEKFQSDVFPEGTCVARGVKGRSPRFYDKKFAAIDPESAEWMGYERMLRALENAHDNTVERLKVREVCAEAKFNFYRSPKI